jgi:hypothetical protein
LDELASASQECQQLLVHVFNHGNFRPHLTEQLIPDPEWKPEPRALDVWLIFASPTDAYESVRPDLQSRLETVDKIEMPSLWDRSEDLMPLSVRFAIQAQDTNLGNLVSEALTDPDKIFLPAAQKVIGDLAPRFGIRALQTVMGYLQGRYAQPYRSDELEQAFSNLSKSVGEKVGQVSRSITVGIPALNANDIVESLSGISAVRFDHIPNERNPAAKVRKATSALRLGLLNKVLEIILGNEPRLNDEIPVREVVRRYSGNDYKSTNSYWDELAEELLIDEKATVEAALSCPPLRRLLESEKLAQRKKRIGGLRAQVEQAMFRNRS